MLGFRKVDNALEKVKGIGVVFKEEKIKGKPTGRSQWEFNEEAIPDELKEYPTKEDFDKAKEGDEKGLEPSPSINSNALNGLLLSSITELLARIEILEAR